MSSGGDRYSFLVDWLDPNAQIVWKYQLIYYPSDGAVEMYDIKNRRSFLKRTHYPSVTLKDLYVGSTVTVYSRQLKIVDYADPYTRSKLESTRERTLAMIKPDGVQNMGKILYAVQECGFIIANFKMVHLTPAQAAEFYFCHQGKEFFEKLVNFMSSGPIIAMELVADNAISKWRTLIGPTDSTKAKSDAPRSIRGMFGTDGTQNAVHGSDCTENANAEIAFFFGDRPGINKHCYSGKGASTLVIVKPHALLAGHAGQIIDQIQSRYVITAAEMFSLEAANAKEFLEVYKGVVAEYSAMVDQLTSGKFIALEVSDPDGECPVDAVREMCGPPDPEIARVLRPHCLRAKFGVDKCKNAVHCTDLAEDGQLEVTYFFDLLQS
mmetsp:Transcript_39472/g.85923  ORF Transcript_39472/g.85923 Transcript_39472/m.85923 type:complete len:380 (-) Transcript_39472:1625-2764(-)